MSTQCMVTLCLPQLGCAATRSGEVKPVVLGSGSSMPLEYRAANTLLRESETESKIGVHKSALCSRLGDPT